MLETARVPSLLRNECEARGMVFAFRFSREGVAESADMARPLDVLTADGSFLWLHVHLTDGRCRKWLSEQDWLTEEAREILLSHDIHDRIETEDNVLAGVFVDAKMDFDDDEEEMAELRFAMTEKILLTGRRRALRSVENTRIAIERGKSMESPLELLEEIVDRESDFVAKAASDLGHEVDLIEDKIMAGYVAEARSLTPGLRRRAIKLHRQMSRLLVLFRRVERAPASRLPQDLRDAAGRIAQRLEFIYQEVHTSQDRARLLQDEVSSFLANETNRQLYILSLLTALFLPATLVTGLFGMNVKGIPFAEEDASFWTAFLLTGAAASLTYLILRLAMQWQKRR